MERRILSAGFCKRAVVCALFTLLAAQVSMADDTWVYAVQISAVVQTAPAQITLSWRPDYHVVTNYIVYRKAKDDTSWGSPTSLPGSATNYVDTDVAVGGTYEYQIVKDAMGFRGYGYIYAGIEAPLTETRGTLILIVANTHAISLSNELARLESDLAGDGWTVVRHDVSSTDTPDSVRNLILNDYYADPAHVNTVFLFGRVPIYHSGNLNYDGHLSRPMPADAFYGDVNGSWNTNLNFLPADVQLMVGRVDMADMPGENAPIPWPTEVELLRNYLNKDHAWRHKLVDVPRRALMGDRRGDDFGQGPASSGYRNFDPLVGPDNTAVANVADISAPEVRWGPMLAADSYMWAYGCAGGMPTGISHLGTDGEFNSLYSTDVVGQDAKAVFAMVFGSWFGDWDGTDNFMRSFLATPTLGLACCMSGRPHWFLHHMGLGETIGYSTRLTMNNSTLYQSQNNVLTRAIYISLMGDPALRMDRVSPPAALNATTGVAGVYLTWSPSAETVLGYHIYRQDSPSQPFTRLTDSMQASTSYVDTSPFSGTCRYMVRAVKLETTPSGTYLNASQGIFANITASAIIPVPILITVRFGGGGLTLTWNTQPGIVYRVLAADIPDLNNYWSDVSSDIMATGTSASWTEYSYAFYTRRFYRVATP